MLTPAAIDHLLAPMTADEFFRDFWEKEYCVIARGDANHYANVLTKRDVDGLLHQYRHSEMAPAQGARVTLVKRSDNHAERRPVPTTSSGLLDIAAVYAAYQRGYTIIIDQAHTHWQPLAALCQSLEGFLRFGVQTNIYVTPRGAQGFAAHFDSHDVLVLQVAGSKAWRMYDHADGPVLPMSDNHTHTPADALRPPVGDFVLQQGDMLYIPRGVVHEAATTDDSSVHVTVGLHVVRVADLLREVITTAAESDVRLRRALPLGYGLGEDESGMDAMLADLLRAVAENVKGADVLNRSTPKFFDRRDPAPDGHFESLDQLETIGIDTRMQRRGGLWCSVVVDDGKAVLSFPGGAVSGPAVLEAAFRFVAQADVFHVRDLPGPAWAPLSASAQVTLAKRLVGRGVARLAPASSD